MSDDDITIRIGDTPHTILCGICKATVAFRDKSDPDSSDIGCSACGNWGNSDEVVKIAFEYAKDEGQMILNRMAKEAARNSKIVTFKGQTTSNKSYRFIVADLKI